jgi:hypothetical protein
MVSDNDRASHPAAGQSTRRECFTRSVSGCDAKPADRGVVVVTEAVFEPGHGSGLVFAGVEANGNAYAYALTQAGGGFTRIASIASGFPAVMDLDFEPAGGHLWAACDDTCEGRTATLDINGQGQFAVTHIYDRPTGMANYNNEGFAIAPQTACIAGHKPVVWSDDIFYDHGLHPYPRRRCAPMAASDCSRDQCTDLGSRHRTFADGLNAEGQRVRASPRRRIDPRWRHHRRSRKPMRSCR